MHARAFTRRAERPKLGSLARLEGVHKSHEPPGMCFSATNYKIGGPNSNNEFTSNIPTLQGHSGVGHSRDAEGWALQDTLNLGAEFGHSRDHSRDIHSRDTEGLGL